MELDDIAGEDPLNGFDLYLMPLVAGACCVWLALATLFSPLLLLASELRARAFGSGHRG